MRSRYFFIFAAGNRNKLIMKKQSLFLFLLFISTQWMLTAQSITLTFSARDVNNLYLPFDSVIVTNMTKNWQKVIVWPDSVLSFSPNSDYAGDAGILLSQNTPNPFVGTTDVRLSTLHEGVTTLGVVDLNGRIVTNSIVTLLDPGTHQFRISLATPGVYMLIARQDGRKSSIRMICKEGGGTSSIDYTGDVPTPDYVLKSDATSLLFNLGDMMEYTGYVTIDGIEMESWHIRHSQEGSQTVVLPFLDLNFVCGTTTISDYDGNVYHTIPFGQQCWIKENLRATILEDGTAIPYSDNVASIIPLEARGYYYPHWAAMKICPAGWRMPSEEDWTTLASYVSSQADYLCTSGQDNFGNAKALASTSYWELSDSACTVGNNPESNNASGFSILPAGCEVDTSFISTNRWAYFHSSTTWTQWYGSHGGPTYIRTFALTYDLANVFIGDMPIEGHLNVRCIKDLPQKGSSR